MWLAGEGVESCDVGEVGKRQIMQEHARLRILFYENKHFGRLQVRKRRSLILSSEELHWRQYVKWMERSRVEAGG